MSEECDHYRVHMHTKPSPGAAYYEGHVDVWAENEEQAMDRAKREAQRRALHDPRSMVVTRVERI